jgi:hypothetical protein
LRIITSRGCWAPRSMSVTGPSSVKSRKIAAASGIRAESGSSRTSACSDVAFSVRSARHCVRRAIG